MVCTCAKFMTSKTADAAAAASLLGPVNFPDTSCIPLSFSARKGGRSNRGKDGGEGQRGGMEGSDKGEGGTDGGEGRTEGRDRGE